MSTLLTGPPGAQAILSRQRAPRMLTTMMLEYEGRFGAPKGTWIPRKSANDPSIYLGQQIESAKSTDKLKVTAFADFVEEQSFGDATQSAWRRDIPEWLSGKRTVSPDKVRQFSNALKTSWIRALLEAGYVQHLVVLTSKLLAVKRMESAAIIAAYIFRTWTKEDDNLTLELLSVGGGFDTELPRIESRLSFWLELPGRVKVEDVVGDELRCVFRLCEPSDHEFLLGGAETYPSAAVQAASAFLLSSVFRERYDPFKRDNLRRTMHSKSQARKRLGVSSR